MTGWWKSGVTATTALHLIVSHTRRTISSFPWPGTIIFVSSKESESSRLDGWPRLDRCQIESELCPPGAGRACRNAERSTPRFQKQPRMRAPVSFSPPRRGIKEGDRLARMGARAMAGRRCCHRGTGDACNKEQRTQDAERRTQYSVPPALRCVLPSVGVSCSGSRSPPLLLLELLLNLRLPRRANRSAAMQGGRGDRETRNS